MPAVTESIVERLLCELLDGLGSVHVPHSGPTPCPDGASGRVEWPPPADTVDDVLAAAWHDLTGQTAAAPEGCATDSCDETGRAVPEQTASATGAAAWPVPGVDDAAGARDSGARVSETVQPGVEVAALAEALDALAAQDLTSLSEGQALARTRWLLQATERMKALSVQALADAEARKLYSLDDAPSLNTWVRILGMPGVDSGDITLSRRLRRVPSIADQVGAGRMSTRTGAALSSVVTKARPFLDRPDGLIDGLDAEVVLAGVLVDGVSQLIAEQIGGAQDAEERLSALRSELHELNDPARTQQTRWEAALVVLARECDPALLSSSTALLVDALLPGEHDKRARKAEEQRGLTLRRHSLGSGWFLKGNLDDETGELLATVLDAAAVTDPVRPEDTRRQAEGRAALDDPTLDPADWPVDQPAPRSRAQQRHDAFGRGLQSLLDSGALGARGKVAPHIGVTVGLDLVEGVPGSLPGRTDHGVRLSREQVRRLLCRGTFTRLVLDARNRVVQVSHTQRTSTALERLILKTQSGAVCSGSGCARGPATGHRLIPHHVSLFSATGVTELADTVLLCEPDHDHELHDKGRNLRLKDGRVIGPDGWVRR